MNPRIEEKILISIKQLSEFKKYLYNKKTKSLFPRRIIESLYFDNIQKQMFLDSEEGCVPRKKIRLRRYYNIKDKIYSNSKLELKISSYEGRFKKSIDIYLVHMGDNVTVKAANIANDLRKHCGKTVLLETLRRSLKSQMREASRSGAISTLILGEKEFQDNNIIVKDMSTGVQTIISISKIIQYFNSK